MKINDDTTIIIGPPGTGKTSTLISMVIADLERGVPPARIGYLSFTRQAIREARSRVVHSVPGADIREFTGFRTLHSMAYWLLGLSRGNITSESAENLADEQFATMYSYARAVSLSPEEAWEELYRPGITVGTELDFLRWVRTYGNKKLEECTMDFSDIVDRMIAMEAAIPFQRLYIDEAQDFTPSQWRAVEFLAKHAVSVIVAGDPDQSVFTWSGVDRHQFESLEGKKVPLTQSHRVPVEVHKVASTILTRAGRTVPYLPTEEQGKVFWLRPEELTDLPFDNGESWFILVRNNYLLPKIRGILFNRGIWASPLAVNKYAHQDKSMRVIQQYQAACEGKTLKASVLRNIEKYCPDLMVHIHAKTPWYEAFTGWPIDTVRYYMAAEEQFGKEKVQYGTFHSCKGAEADNVVLLADSTKPLARGFNTDKDLDESRLLYVAVTRARKNLYLVGSNHLRKAYQWAILLNSRYGLAPCQDPTNEES